MENSEHTTSPIYPRAMGHGPIDAPAVRVGGGGIGWALDWTGHVSDWGASRLNRIRLPLGTPGLDLAVRYVSVGDETDG